jgi:hypothetical protein
MSLINPLIESPNPELIADRNFTAIIALLDQIIAYDEQSGVWAFKVFNRKTGKYHYVCLEGEDNSAQWAIGDPIE